MILQLPFPQKIGVNGIVRREKKKMEREVGRRYKKERGRRQSRNGWRQQTKPTPLPPLPPKKRQKNQTNLKNIQREKEDGVVTLEGGK